jgi:uncharacterized protein involved in type VI secretion and phage assembly
MSQTSFSPKFAQETESMSGQHWYGAYPALVTDIRDPDQQGRVKVTLPWAKSPLGEQYEAWARLATLAAGINRGTWFIPDVNDEVLVVFQAGDPSLPFVVGSLWNGRDSPPMSMDQAGENNLKIIRSRNGTTITLDDTSGSEQFSVTTPGGAKLILRDGPSRCEITDSNGNTIKMEAFGITITASSKIVLTASTVEISAGEMTANCGQVKFSGTVMADTIVVNNVVAASYTPGAGNIL